MLVQENILIREDIFAEQKSRDSHTVFVNRVVNASHGQSRKSPGIIAVGKAGQNALLTKGLISGSFANLSYILWYPMDKAVNNFERDPGKENAEATEFWKMWGQGFSRRRHARREVSF